MMVVNDIINYKHLKEVKVKASNNGVCLGRGQSLAVAVDRGGLLVTAVDSGGR
jgi:hypothetical protein